MAVSRCGINPFHQDMVISLPLASGVCAGDGFELDLAWKDGRLTRLSVLFKAGELCKIEYQGEVKEFPTEKGR